MAEPSRSRDAQPLTDTERTEQHPRTDDDLLTIARARFSAAMDAESATRRLQELDLAFLGGAQWEGHIRAERARDRRPCFTINRLPQFLHQVINEQRQHPPAIRIQPVDDQADVETAKILQGIIRHIEVSSHADIAYDTARQQQVGQGLGYFRVLTAYEHPLSFQQVLKIQRIRNRFSVYVDPSFQQPDGSDMQWAFVVERLSRAAFVAQYGQIPDQAQAWMSTGDMWLRPDEVQIAEYFYREEVAVEIALLGDGTVLRRRDVPEGMPVMATRTTHVPQIWWCKINGYQVLERTRWLGQYIPIIPVLGDELVTAEGTDYIGLVRFAQDPQRLYNYWVSAETEAIALAPRAPFIGAEGQFEGHEQRWDNANTRNYAYLEYKPTSSAGVPLPPPQRMALEPAVQAITQARMLAVDDIKAVTGLYDAALGNRSNETSGVGIRARKSESDTATAHFPLNFNYALRHCGVILLDLIPKIYDRATILRIIGEDGQPQQVPVNQPFQDAQGVERLYQLGVGRYDVAISTGATYATQREEAVDKMTQLVQAYPPLLQAIGDQLIQHIDFPGAPEIAERLKLLLPPQLQQQGDPQQMQQAMQQMSQQLEQINAYAKEVEKAAQQLQQTNQELELRLADKTAENTLKAEELAIEREKNLWDMQLKEQELALKAQTARAATNGQES
jgi:hypothetical protein